MVRLATQRFTPSIGVLHAEPREVDVRLVQQLANSGVRAHLVDVRQQSAELVHLDCVINRVYPSTVFEQPVAVLHRTLDIVMELEQRQTLLINGYQASQADYFKSTAVQMLAAANVRTPRTIALDDIEDLGQPPFLPLVLKLDTGGFGRDCLRVATVEEWGAALRSMDWKLRPRIVQEFVVSAMPFDYRLTVMFGKVAFAYRRTLVDGWLGSSDRGSLVEMCPVVPEEAASVAIGATQAVGGHINGVDIVIGESGPWVIENNLTPAFSPHSWEGLPLNPIQTFCKEVIEYLRRKLSNGSA